ncbi:Major facilitator superfamily domain general substrate transporter, partial [Penicillium angulare]
SFTMFIGRTLRLAQVLLIVAPTFILYGYNQAGIGPLSTLQSWVHTFPEIDSINTTGKQQSQNSTKKGTVIASFQLGALVGALSCIYFSEKLGRRKPIFIGAILTIVGQVLQSASYGIIQFTIGRVILGLGVGQFSVAVPVWQAESSSAKNRGQHVVVDGICICFGYVLCNWIDFGLSMTSGDLQWRVPLAISVIFSLIVLGSVFLIPESPRWLVIVGQVDKATHSLAAYRGLSPDDEAVRAEIDDIQLSLEMTTGSPKSLVQEVIFGEDKDRLIYRFCLCIALQFFQQMCGGNLISTYVSTIFEQNLKMSTELSHILAACALTWKFLCNFIPFFTIDRIGRRKVFMISGVGMCACMTVLAITSSFGTSSKSASTVSAVFVFLFNTFYPIGFSGANFLYCTEVAPIRLRGAMSAMSTANHWLWNFVVVMITPVALDTIGYRYYIIYIVISACIPVSVYFFYPETMNCNLEALGHVFRDSRSPWDIVATARTPSKREGAEVDLWIESEEKVSVEQKENA